MIIKVWNRSNAYKWKNIDETRPMHSSFSPRIHNLAIYSPPQLAKRYSRWTVLICDYRRLVVPTSWRQIFGCTLPEVLIKQHVFKTCRSLADRLRAPHSNLKLLGFILASSVTYRYQGRAGIVELWRSPQAPRGGAKKIFFLFLSETSKSVKKFYRGG